MVNLQQRGNIYKKSTSYPGLVFPLAAPNHFPYFLSVFQSIMPTLALLSLHGQFPLSIEHSSLSFLASPSYLSDPSLWSSLTAQSKVYTPPVFYHIA